MTFQEKNLPHLHAVAWETTRKCPLNCIHCRAAAANTLPEDELSTEEGLLLIDGIADFAKTMLILTGGEPMTRPDIYQLASHATSRGLRVVMAPCGHLITPENTEKMKSAGIKALSISLDGADASTHDSFRGTVGAFEKSLMGIRHIRDAHIHFQINSTISRLNAHQIPQIVDLAEDLGAAAVDFFFLVPTGRGKKLDSEMLTTSEYEKTLHWIAEERTKRKIRVKTTCAPHFARISRSVDSESHSGGCLAGGGFVFVSHRGIMQPCGFLDVPCGDLRKSGFNFGKLYLESEVFRSLRNPDRYEGRCGICEFRMVCGGCRARAYAANGDILSADPTCSHIPRTSQKNGEIGEFHKNELLLRLQQGIPLNRHPFYTMATELGLTENQILSFVGSLFSHGEARRIGGIFDGRKLGYKNTLCAASPLPEKREDFISYVRSLPGVTHFYERGWPDELKPGIPGSPEDENYMRLWFTFGAPADTFAKEFAEIGEMNKGGTLLSLPAVRMFKTDVIFDLKQLKNEKSARSSSDSHKPLVLEQNCISENDKQIIRLIQGNLPVKRELYAEPAAQLGISPEELIGKLKIWQSGGILKRVGLLLNHLNVGFKANGMCVWRVPEEKIEEKGRILASYPAITHCYQRIMDNRFPYNLYAMTHAGSWEDLYSIFINISKENSLEGGQLFCSIKEIKKTSMSYFL